MLGLLEEGVVPSVIHWSVFCSLSITIFACLFLSYFPSIYSSLIIFMLYMFCLMQFFLYYKHAELDAYTICCICCPLNLQILQSVQWMIQNILSISTSDLN